MLHTEKPVIWSRSCVTTEQVMRINNRLTEQQVNEIRSEVWAAINYRTTAVSSIANWCVSEWRRPGRPIFESTLPTVNIHVTRWISRYAITHLPSHQHSMFLLGGKVSSLNFTVSLLAWRHNGLLRMRFCTSITPCGRTKVPTHTK